MTLDYPNILSGIVGIKHARKSKHTLFCEPVPINFKGIYFFNWKKKETHLIAGWGWNQNKTKPKPLKC